MKTWMKQTQLLVVVVCASLAFVGCQKKRDAELPYGADRELLTISNFEGKDFNLTTQGLLAKSQTTGKIEVQDARAKTKELVKNSDYVEYTSEDPLKLTDDTLMLGRPHHSYKVRYVFEGDLLKVMKIAKAEDLAMDELASSVDAGLGLRMVPIVSYGVSYYSMDAARNERKEKTSRLELVSQQSRSQATHFKISMNSKTRAQFLSKTTVLPSDFFTGKEGKTASQRDEASDWYFAMTVVSQNYREERSWNGFLGAMDKYGREAIKVRARKTEDKIIFYNLGIDDRMEQSLDKRLENQAIAVAIPTEFIDYRLRENGKTSSVTEEAHKEQAFDKRLYMDLRLKDIRVALGDLQISEIKDIQLDDGYFSFLVSSEAIGGLVRFSFLNTKQYTENQLKLGAQKYSRKVYFREDQRLFGFFKTVQENLNTFDRSRSSQREQFIFVNRYNPTRPTIEIRLNHSAPKWSEEIFLRSVAGWNAAFKAAGSRIQIKATDEKTGEALRGHPGDLRYTLVNIYADVDGASDQWGGFGPSLADTQTGEIIMATANVDTSSYIRAVEITLNNYLMSERGALESKFILGLPMPSVQMVADTATKTINTVGRFLGIKQLSQFRKYDPKSKSFVANNLVHYDTQSRKFITDMQLKSQDESQTQSLNFSNQSRFEGRFNVLNGKIVEQIKQVCPELQARSQEKEDVSQDIKLIKACANELAKPILIAVTLHEMGHNFGLRHNFYGSTDYNNFYAKTPMQMGNKQVLTQWHTSSIMDYMTLNYDAMDRPGRYDIAALRWGYESSVEKIDGKIVKIDTRKSTTSQIGNDFRHYKYCTDEDVDSAQRDPLCARQDVGMSAPLTKEERAAGKKEPNRILEVVQEYINQYDASIATQNSRFGRDAEKSMETLAFNRFSQYVLPMKNIYDKWRYELGVVAGSGNEYLESFNTKEKFDDLVKRALDPAVVGPKKALENAHYKEASEKVFEFLTYMAFIPDYSCATKRTVNGEETLQLFSFSKIQQSLHGKTGHTAKNCQDAKVHEYLKLEYDATVVAEGGYSFENIYGDLTNPEYTDTTYSKAERPEFVGVAIDRFLVWQILTGRYYGLEINNRKQFYPNFIDELPKRQKLISLTTVRLNQGTPLFYFGVEDAAALSFEAEKPLLGVMTEFLRTGLGIPGRESETIQNFDSFRVVPYYYVESDDAPCAQINGMRWCALSKKGFAGQLIEAYNEVQQLKLSSRIDANFEKNLLGFVSDLVPENYDDLTVGFFFQLMQKMGQLEGKPGADMIAVAIQNIFAAEIEIIQNGIGKQIKKLREEDISKKEYEEKLNEIKKIKVKDLVTKLGLEEQYKEPMTKKVLAARGTKMSQAMQANKGTYLSNKTEIDAKADVLLQAIMNNITIY